MLIDQRKSTTPSITLSAIEFHNLKLEMERLTLTKPELTGNFLPRNTAKPVLHVFRADGDMVFCVVSRSGGLTWVEKPSFLADLAVKANMGFNIAPSCVTELSMKTPTFYKVVSYRVETNS